MFADDLRKSILQDAIQGKLTEQLPTDGNAKDLLADIHAERAKLIKQKKIKPVPPLPPISADEIPFDIPENWLWVRLGDIGETNIGLTYSPQNISNDGVIVLRSGNIQNGKINYDDIVKVAINIPENKLCKAGDILICARNGSKKLVGKAAIVDKDNLTFGAFMALFRSKFNPYILAVINSPYFRNTFINEVGTTTINQITQNMLKNFLIPLPPLAEQVRIVAKVDALLAEIEPLAEAERELEKLEKEFPRKMKASLLQAAIQGKLSEQLPTDGDAKDLLADIQAEKLRLIKENKIKPAPPLPPIKADEIPFDIPKNWQWVRLDDICEMYTGNSISEHEKQTKYLGRTEGFDFIATKDISFENEVTYNNGVKIPFENNFKRAKENSVLMCIEGGSAGRKIALVNREVCFGNKLCNFNAYKILNEYLYFYLQSLAFAKFFTSGIVGIIGGVGINKLKNFIVPLPPLAEQKRIVARLEELLKELDF